MLPKESENKLELTLTAKLNHSSGTGRRVRRSQVKKPLSAEFWNHCLTPSTAELQREQIKMQTNMVFRGTLGGRNYCPVARVEHGGTVVK